MTFKLKIPRPSKNELVHVAIVLKVMTANHFRHLLFASILAASCAYGATLLGGTYYAVVLSKDFVVVAIDSRARDLNGLTPAEDSYCKISPLADNLLFFATGFVKGGGGLNIDAFEGAKTSYVKAADRADLDAMANSWSRDMRDQYLSAFGAYPELKIRLARQVMVKGFFVGFDKADTLRAAEADVKSPSPGDVSIAFRDHRQNGEEVVFFHGGHQEVLIEIANQGQTQRGREVLAEIASKVAGLPMVEAMAVRAEVYVRIVRDWAHDPGIGGEIAVAIVERGKKWRWYRRPAFCPEN